jgi:DNA-binding response OmpR family regulator
MGPCEAAIVVAIDGELGRLGPALQQALGSSYRVLPTTAAREAQAAVLPARLAVVDEYRARCGRTLIVVYDEVRRDPTPFLEAAADDYVAHCSMGELAARIRAGMRRLRPRPISGR